MYFIRDERHRRGCKGYGQDREIESPAIAKIRRLYLSFRKVVAWRGANLWASRRMNNDFKGGSRFDQRESLAVPLPSARLQSWSPRALELETRAWA